MKDIVRQVAGIQGVHLAVIFRLGLEYGEFRAHPKRLHELYNEFIINGKLPRCVSDFALDVLAGRVQVPRAVVRRAK